MSATAFQRMRRAALAAAEKTDQEESIEEVQPILDTDNEGTPDNTNIDSNNGVSDDHEAFKTDPKYLNSVKEVVHYSSKPINKMNVPELRAYAETNGIDLGGATKKDEIFSVITAAKDGSEHDD